MSDQPSGVVPADPVLYAVLRSAVEATGAADGWIAALDDGADQLVVVAAEGPRGRRLLGVTVGEHEGFSGYVVGSAQPLAIEPAADDPRLDEGIAARLDRRPRSVLCVPCEDDDIVLAAIELVDKDGGGFTFDDLELVAVLADVAGVALRLGAGGASLLPTPAELGALLEGLAGSDPVRYARVAELVAMLVRRE